jgi:hypothetical protein
VFEECVIVVCELAVVVVVVWYSCVLQCTFVPGQIWLAMQWPMVPHTMGGRHPWFWPTQQVLSIPMPQVVRVDREMRTSAENILFIMLRLLLR